ncbi:MAG: aryl-sulfate sulfotransferase, partial [Myxococcota bacterium]
DVLDRRTPDAVGRELSVLGLGAGRTWRWRAVVVDDAGVRHASTEATFATPPPPDGFPRIEVTAAEPGAEVRYVLAAMIDEGVSSFVGIFDRDGTWVWWVVPEEGQVVVTPELGLDRRSVLWAEYDTDKNDDHGQIVRVSLDGTVRTVTRVARGHHDFVEHDDGTIAYLALTFTDAEGAGGEPIRLASDQIRVVPEGAVDADEPALVFDMFRDFDGEPVLTCNHQTSPEDRFGEAGSLEWTHANSLVYASDEGAYYVGQKVTDTILKVDRATGAVDWAMNGMYGEFTLPDGSAPWQSVTNNRLWSHPHWSSLGPTSAGTGSALVFDNGDHHTPLVSRAIEIAWDEDAREVEILWELPHEDGGQTRALGDVRRMPAGDVLITWAGLGDLEEVTPDATANERAPVWQAALPPGWLAGRIVPLDDLYAPTLP